MLLGFTLSLDNFRVSLGLGMLHPGIRRAAGIALVYGAWDGLSPLAGLLLGRYFAGLIGPLADLAGPVVLIAYGTYLLVNGLRGRVVDSLDDRVVLLGLPLSLSLDNLVAGTGLGLAGFSPVIPALTFGTISAAMSFIGLQAGRLAGRFVPVHPDVLGGLAMMATALMLAAGL